VEKKVRGHLMRARERSCLGWKRWSRKWLYEKLGLYNDYRLRRPWSLLKVQPAESVTSRISLAGISFLFTSTGMVETKPPAWIREYNERMNRQVKDELGSQLVALNNKLNLLSPDLELIRRHQAPQGEGTRRQTVSSGKTGLGQSSLTGLSSESTQVTPKPPQRINHLKTLLAELR